ncbi:MAG TPA: hypothetical protein VKR32_00470 [Puia sp.]|nr:hypothetical protein [Puia sp.]
MDIIGVACKLKDITEKYKEMTGINHNLRETLRTLNKREILKLIQPKGTIRSLYWVKTEWLEDNNTRLKDQYSLKDLVCYFVMI